MDDILIEQARSMAGAVCQDRRLRSLDIEEVASECLLQIAAHLERPSMKRPGIRPMPRTLRLINFTDKNPRLGKGTRLSVKHSRRYESLAFVPPALHISDETFPTIRANVIRAVHEKLLRQLGYHQTRVAGRRQPWTPRPCSLPENLPCSLQRPLSRRRRRS